MKMVKQYHLKGRNNFLSLKLENYIREKKENVNQVLKDAFISSSIPQNLKESMHYSLFAGGKRLRPILLYASYETYDDNVTKTNKTAAALEMIHTYSLIHDDLPAMDDDDFRRGHPTNHRQFDEATAILAGDALLTYSFEMIANDEQLSAEEKVVVLKWLAHCSGPEGMVGGQILDIEAESSQLSLEQMEKVHELKTGKLIQFAIYIGAFLAKVDEKTLNQLQHFSYYLGLIFQVQDDILDIVGTEEKLGKPVGSDEGNEKSTYPKLLGLEGAKKQKQLYVEKATKALHCANGNHSYLLSLLQYFSERDH